MNTRVHLELRRISLLSGRSALGELWAVLIELVSPVPAV